MPTMIGGAGKVGGKLRTHVGLVPTPAVPPQDTTAHDCRQRQMPNCVPISRENVRFAATTRASISTCCDFRSSCRIRLSSTGSVLGISRMIRYSSGRPQECLRATRGTSSAWRPCPRPWRSSDAGCGHHVGGLGLRLGQVAVFFRFLLQRFLGGDAKHVAIELLIEIVVLAERCPEPDPTAHHRERSSVALHRRDRPPRSSR